MAELYRANLVYNGGGSTWGNTNYYEGTSGFEKLKVDLLEAYLNAKPHAPWYEWMLRNAWVKHLYGKDKYPYPDKIFKAEQLIDGEWVVLEVQFIHPEVIVNVSS